MQKYAFVLICLLSLVSLNMPAYAQSGPSADKVKLRNLLSQITTLQAQFIQQVDDVQGNRLQDSQGSLLMQHPNRIYWEVTTPDETQLIANGEQVYYVDNFVEQVSIYSQSAMVTNNPLMLLTSDDDAVWAQFTVSQLATSSIQQFTVTPTTPQSQIVELSLGFAQGQLQRFTLVDNQGQVSQFNLSNQVTNMPLPVNAFSFTVPAGFSIDDQTQTQSQLRTQ